MATLRSPNWCFTVNNPAGLLHPDEDDFSSRHVSFLSYAEEVGDSGTYHLQGYLEFNRKVSLSHCKKVPGLERAHFETRRGTQEQAIAYTNKPAHPDRFAQSEIDTYVAGPYVWGQKKEPGRRTDLLAVRSALDNGASMSSIARDHFASFVRYERGFRSYLGLTGPQRNFESIVMLFLGPSGTGKSTLAGLLAKTLASTPDSVFRVAPPKGSGLYFDGYDRHEVMIFDEFDGYFMTPTYFNQLCQPFPFSLPVHGAGNVQLLAKYIIICSNYHPAYWWKKRHQDEIYQTTRRIHAFNYMLVSDQEWAKRKARASRIPGRQTAKCATVVHADNMSQILISPAAGPVGALTVNEK